jgi:hypothetical protein
VLSLLRFSTGEGWADFTQDMSADRPGCVPVRVWLLCVGANLARGLVCGLLLSVRTGGACARRLRGSA